MTRLRLMACIGSFGLACVATFLILGGLAVFAAAERGDLPRLHLVER